LTEPLSTAATVWFAEAPSGPVFALKDSLAKEIRYGGGGAGAAVLAPAPALGAFVLSELLFVVFELLFRAI
jgi:hypothetical protein